MRFLANENFPLPSTRVLRNNGHDVICVGDVMGGATDQAVLSYATEHQLIILTFDRDYGEMLFKYQSISPPAIVYFRLMNYLPADAGSLLLSYLNRVRLF